MYHQMYRHDPASRTPRSYANAWGAAVCSLPSFAGARDGAYLAARSSEASRRLLAHSSSNLCEPHPRDKDPLLLSPYGRSNVLWRLAHVLVAVSLWSPARYTRAGTLVYLLRWGGASGDEDAALRVRVLYVSCVL